MRILAKTIEEVHQKGVALLTLFPENILLNKNSQILLNCWSDAKVINSSGLKEVN